MTTGLQYDRVTFRAPAGKLNQNYEAKTRFLEASKCPPGSPKLYLAEIMESGSMALCHCVLQGFPTF